jgi:hypothetical protein
VSAPTVMRRLIACLLKQNGCAAAPPALLIKPRAAELGAGQSDGVPNDPEERHVTALHSVGRAFGLERSPHFHLWLVPKKKGGALRGVAYLAHRAAPASSSAAQSISKKIRRRFERHGAGCSDPACSDELSPCPSRTMRVLC